MSKQLTTVFIPTKDRKAKYVLYGNGKAPNSLNRIGRCELKQAYLYTEEEHQEVVRKEEVNQSNLLNSRKNWTEDYEHENGNYMNKCNSCKHNFLGHKRRFICKQCAEQQVVGELIEGEHPDEIYPRAGSWLAERRNWAAQVKMLEEQIEGFKSQDITHQTIKQ